MFSPRGWSENEVEEVKFSVVRLFGQAPNSSGYYSDRVKKGFHQEVKHEEKQSIKRAMTNVNKITA